MVFLNVPNTFSSIPIYIQKKDLDAYLSIQQKRIRLGLSIVISLTILINAWLVLRFYPVISEIRNTLDITNTYMTYFVYSGEIIILVIGIFMLKRIWEKPMLEQDKVQYLKSQKEEMIRLPKPFSPEKEFLYAIIYSGASMFTLSVILYFSVGIYLK